MKMESTMAIFEGWIFNHPEVADWLTTVLPDPVAGMVKEGGDEGVDGVLGEADFLRVDRQVSVEGLGDGDGTGFDYKGKFDLSF